MTLDEFEKYLNDPSLMNKGFAAPVVIENAKSLIHYCRELEAKLKDADKLENEIALIHANLKKSMEDNRLLTQLYWWQRTGNEEMESLLIQLRDEWFEPHYGQNDMGMGRLFLDKIIAVLGRRVRHDPANMQSGDHAGCRCEAEAPHA